MNCPLQLLVVSSGTLPPGPLMTQMIRVPRTQGPGSGGAPSQPESRSESFSPAQN